MSLGELAFAQLTRTRSAALFVALGAAVLQACSAAQAITAGVEDPAPTGSRRFLVMLHSASSARCSGVLIRRDLVLTAAHCLARTDGLRVTVLNRKSEPNTTPVSAVALHPTFDASLGPTRQTGTDLALVQLAKPLGPDFTPVSLGFEPPPHDVLVAGFGVAVEVQKTAQLVPRSAVLTRLGRHSTGVDLYADPQTRAQERGSGACRGDSGGPVLSTLGTITPTLVGIVTWSSGPFVSNATASCGGVTAATAIAPHKAWIEDTSMRFGSRQARSSR